MGSVAVVTPYKRRNFGGPRPVGKRLQFVMNPAVSINARRGAPLATRGFRARYGNRGELKMYQTASVLSSVASTGQVVNNLFLPTLGSDYTNRIGRKVRIRSIGIRAFSTLYAAQQNAADLGANANVFARSQHQRVMLVYDTQPNGVGANTTDILDSAAVISMNNLANRDRFRVLMDKVFTFDPYHVSTDDTPVIQVHSENRTCVSWTFWKKCNMETIFNGANGGNIGDVTTGAFLLLMVSSETTLNFVGNAIRYVIRFRFEDM